MVFLEALLDAAQNRHGILFVRRLDHDRLEAPFKRRVLLHVLAVLVQRRRAYAVQFAARQHRLEHVAGVRRALRLARADDRVDFVYEEDYASFGLLDLLQDRFQALLELTPVHGASHERGHVEREHGMILNPVRHVAAHDTLRETLHDSRLAHAGLTYQDRVVLRLARQYANDVTDLGVPSDNGVQFARAG